MPTCRSRTPYFLRPLPTPGPGTPLLENSRLYLGAHVWHNDHTEAWLAQISAAEAQDRQVQFESDWYEVYTSSDGDEVFKDHVMGLNEVAEMFLRNGESAEEFIAEGFEGRMSRFVGVFLGLGEERESLGSGAERSEEGGADGCSSTASRKRPRPAEFDEVDDGDEEYQVNGEGEEDDDDDEDGDGSERSEDEQCRRPPEKSVGKPRPSKKRGKAVSGRAILAHFESIDACNPWADRDGDDKEIISKVKDEADDDVCTKLPSSATGTFSVQPKRPRIRGQTMSTMHAAKARHAPMIEAPKDRHPSSRATAAPARKPSNKSKASSTSKSRTSAPAPPQKRTKSSPPSSSATDITPDSLSTNPTTTAHLLRTALTTLCASKPPSLTTTSPFLTALGTLSLATTAPAIAAASRKVLTCLQTALQTATEACQREEAARNEAAELGRLREELDARGVLVEMYRKEVRGLTKEWEDWDGGVGELEEAVRVG